jgi:hypothetical protein
LGEDVAHFEKGLGFRIWGLDLSPKSPLRWRGDLWTRIVSFVSMVIRWFWCW